MLTTHLDPMIAAGIGGTIAGSLDIANGHVLKGTKTVLLGMTSTNLGGRLQGLHPISHSMLMQNALAVGIGAVGVQGAVLLARGVKQKNAAEIIKGSIQTAAGIAATALVYSLDSKILVIAHQASVLALSSSFIAKLGFNELVKGHYRSGVCKILLGLSGIAGAGYYLYNACINKETFPLKESLSADQRVFLETHKAEIEEMYENKRSSGNWKLLGEGASKKVFEHEGLAGMLVKIPVAKDGVRGSSCEDDLRINQANLEELRSTAVQFDRIVFPESHLYPTSKGLIIIEQKFNQVERFSLVDYNDSEIPYERDKQEAIDQFKVFVNAARLCDLHPHVRHNTGIINRAPPFKIGIFDFDCSRPKSGSPHTLGGLAILVAGIAVLDKVPDMISKKISKINPKKILKIGLGVGAATATYLASRDDLNQPLDTMMGAGFAMVVTAFVTFFATTQNLFSEKISDLLKDILSD